MNAYLARNAEKAGAKLGSPTTDQVFIPITPCRMVDTRNVGGPLTFGNARNFNFYASTAGYTWASQGGPSGAASTTCPGTVNPNGGAPSAAMATITVVTPSGSGNFVAWGGASPVPLTSVLNWNNAGDIAANTTVIPAGGRSGVGPGGSIQDFAIYYNGFQGAAQIIVDVVGYFVTNQATPLSCTTIPSLEVTVTAGSTGVANRPNCPMGYTLTGTSCYASSALMSLAVTEGYCAYKNYDPATQSAIAYSRCCRVPGL